MKGSWFMGAEPQKKEGFWDWLQNGFTSSVDFLAKQVGNVIDAGTEVVSQTGKTASQVPGAVFKGILGAIAGRSLKKVFKGMGLKGFTDDEKKNAEIEASHAKVEKMIDEMKKENAKMYAQMANIVAQTLQQKASQQGLQNDPYVLYAIEQAKREAKEAAKAAGKMPVWAWALIGVGGAGVLGTIIYLLTR
ncbi:MAG: hypothetical protein DRP01_03805 [Archaeoglobales archaeon]|nr:MAG: hypothetical protein DRP01_03805 [Archaeoglobales archaeon]